MKFLIASDLHGSVKYVKQLLAAIQRENADKVILLGDLLYHGPRNGLSDEYDPQIVAELLNGIKQKLICVRGNCDSEVDQMLLEFPIMARYAVLPLGERSVYLTHGHIYNECNLPPLSDGDILIYGHTHVPLLKEVEKVVCMNPGSVSLPKNQSYHGYILLENSHFIFKDLSGEIKNEFKA